MSHKPATRSRHDADAVYLSLELISGKPLDPRAGDLHVRVALLEKVARAVQYGFGGAGAPAATDPAQALPAPMPAEQGGRCGRIGGTAVGKGPLGPIKNKRQRRAFEAATS